MKIPKRMPSWELVLSFCTHKGICESDARYVYNRWIEKDYKVRSGPILDWRACIMTMKRNNWLKSQRADPPGLVEHKRYKGLQLAEAKRDRLKAYSASAPVSEEERERVGRRLREWREQNR
jgi:hypothetical protein